MNKNIYILKLIRIFNKETQIKYIFVRLLLGGIFVWVDFKYEYKNICTDNLEMSILIFFHIIY